MKRGGARPGAGRPPKFETQLERAKKLAKRLQTALRAGLDELGEAYPELMRKGIQAALEGDKKMLQFLLSLLPQMVSPEDEDSPIYQLVQRWSKEPHRTIDDLVKEVADKVE